MELVARALDRPPPSWWTAVGPRLVHDRARATSLSSSLSSSDSASAQHVSVQRAALEDFFSLSSSMSINPRTSVEAALQGTKIRMLEMRLKMQHMFPRLQMQGKSMDHVGLVGLTAATDLNRRHRLTLESTLGSEEDRQSLSTFVSSNSESRLSWGLALSQKVQQTLTFFSRFNRDGNARDRFILQVVHKLNDKTTLSPIVSVSTGCHPQAGISLTSQLIEIGLLGENFVQVKGFYSGGGAYSFSIKAQAGQLD